MPKPEPLPRRNSAISSGEVKMINAPMPKSETSAFVALRTTASGKWRGWPLSRPGVCTRMPLGYNQLAIAVGC